MTARDDLRAWYLAQLGVGSDSSASEQIDWLCAQLDACRELKEATLEATDWAPLRNAVFNPQFDGLRVVCAQASEDGYGLSHVVSVTEHQWVAVFTRPGDDGPIYQVFNNYIPEKPRHTCADGTNVWGDAEGPCSHCGVPL